MGLYVSYRILDYADLTVDGSLALGGAVAAVCLSKGLPVLLTIPATLLAGAAAGLVTGILHTKLQIPGILAGILTMISLYSINVTIMARANISLLGTETIFSRLAALLGCKSNTAYLLAGIGIVAVLIVLLQWFFFTEIGQLVRATGDNAEMVCSQGYNPKNFKILALSLSNSLVSLAGGLIAQQQGYADVAMGTGSIVIGLASVIIGEVVFGKRFSLWYALLGAVLGSVLYRLAISFVLYLGLRPTLLNLLTAAIVTVALSIPAVREELQRHLGGLKKC